MGRPKKDPLAPPKVKMFDVAKLPLGPGRVCIIKYPVGGLGYDEIAFVTNYMKLLEVTHQEDLDLDNEVD